MKNNQLFRLAGSAVCLALALVLPFITGQIPKIGNMLSPMHLPVFLCGFVCGSPWGAAVGFIAPLLRSVFFSAPPLFPKAVAMAFELCVYGGLSGLLFRILPKKPYSVFVSLITSMIAGRLVWGAVRLILAGISGTEFPFSAFISGAITTGVPGIVIQIILVPVIVLSMQKAGLIPDSKKGFFKEKSDTTV